MTASNDIPVKSQEQRQSDLAPEMHNDEQDDHRSQAQEVSEQARNPSMYATSPTESAKSPTSGDIIADSAQDTIDHMRDMESSGRIDMDAYAGEPNHDDNVDKYGRGTAPRELPDDAS
ncbi:hypothetical protein [Altererythrobacter sp. MF3-039]|uniref:hypothetical protein n=1 Tax=Altererythrobacter sp. MF3-039 TaxID=3252901 RepID=UPI00390C70A3